MAEYKDLTAQLRLFETVCRHSEKPDIADLVRCAWQAIEELAKNSPKHGKWCINSEYEYIECSLCGGAFYTGADSTNEAKRFMENGYAPNYCPSCGADMRPRPKEET